MANLIRKREPGRQLSRAAATSPFQMMREMLTGDLFDELFRRDPFAELESSLVPRLRERMFSPDIEIKETKDNFVLEADVPGLKEENLDIDISGQRLTISGHREEKKEEEEERCYTYERSYGSFSRSMVLPEGVDVNQITADLKDGVLRVVVPKREGEKAKKITIGGQKEAPVSTEGEKAKQAKKAA